MKQSRIAIAVLAGAALGVAGDQLATRALRPSRQASPAALAVPAPSRPAPQAAQPPARQPVPAPQGAEDSKAVYRVPIDGSPVRGPATALVTIIEVSDFECPFCKRAGPVLQQVEKAYGQKVRLVFKQSPLSMHRNAIPAAKLAEEARVEGGDARFWAMHDELFALPSLDRPSLEQAARKVGLAPAGVKEALDGPKHLDRIRRDQNLASSLGARGTPTFFVNGRKLVGAQPFEAFRALIDEELAKAEALVRSGVAPRDVYARLIEKGATAPVLLPGAGIAAAQVARIPLRPDDPVRGPKVAPVTVVLFSDFQCPYCAKVEPTLGELRGAYGDQLRIVWKHLPLPFHPQALPAAKAAEAARASGRFWEMHDKLIAGSQTLSEAAYAAHARELALDAGRFQAAAGSEDVARRIAEDKLLAANVGATGTPTLFVNCRRMVGAQPLEAFKQVVDEELKRAEGMRAKGDKLDEVFYDRICATNVAGVLAAR